MSIFIKSIERRLYFVSLWSFDISVFFCIFTYCISFTHCQINRYENKKITPLMTLVEWAVLCTKILPPSFQRSTLESSSSSALFYIFIIPKRKRNANVVNPCFLSQSNTSKNITKHINIHFYNHSRYFLIYTFLTIVTNNI